jgi:hypothetical protein
MDTTRNHDWLHQHERVQLVQSLPINNQTQPRYNLHSRNVAPTCSNATTNTRISHNRIETRKRQKRRNGNIYQKVIGHSETHRKLTRTNSLDPTSRQHEDQYYQHIPATHTITSETQNPRSHSQIRYRRHPHHNTTPTTINSMWRF